MSSCKTIQLLPIQKYGFDILTAAFEKSKTYISILPDDDKVDDDLVSIKGMSDAWNAAEGIQRSSIWFGGIRPVLLRGDFEKIGTLL